MPFALLLTMAIWAGWPSSTMSTRVGMDSAAVKYADGLCQVIAAYASWWCQYHTPRRHIVALKDDRQWHGADVNQGKLKGN